MNRLILFAIAFMLWSCNGKAQQDNEEFKISKSDAEWKEELSEAEYRILRKAGTEKAFSSPLNDISEPGVFVCAACGNELYRTKNKFESGTGWPSFDRPIENATIYDGNISFRGSEVKCADCGGHLGHVFNDGPQETTGKRHCINGLAMDFIPEKE